MAYSSDNIKREQKEYVIYFEIKQQSTKIIENVLVVPVSKTSAERSFSTMKRIKTYLRSTMTKGVLHYIIMLIGQVPFDDGRAKQIVAQQVSGDIVLLRPMYKRTVS
ncbi:CBL-interacting protein kinase 1 [Aphis craccivora]|uniref:CBL-interacting protein kinase 1 n=1 Tax=Aphis craccivora TaxID=307492 RepID=A0A6G0YMH4_APHCR|nr:CBL-interacting protein kinase 1 [Aphis craccivora]